MRDPETAERMGLCGQSVRVRVRTERAPAHLDVLLPNTEDARQVPDAYFLR